MRPKIIGLNTGALAQMQRQPLTAMATNINALTDVALTVSRTTTKSSSPAQNCRASLGSFEWKHGHVGHAMESRRMIGKASPEGQDLTVCVITFPDQAHINWLRSGSTDGFKAGQVCPMVLL